MLAEQQIMRNNRASYPDSFVVEVNRDIYYVIFLFTLTQSVSEYMLVIKVQDFSNLYIHSLDWKVNSFCKG